MGRVLNEVFFGIIIFFLIQGGIPRNAFGKISLISRENLPCFWREMENLQVRRGPGERRLRMCQEVQWLHGSLD